MPLKVTGEDIERAERTIDAADLLRHNANVVEAACDLAGPHDIVVAVVTPELEFSGAEILPLGDLHRYVAALVPGGWHQVFSPRTAKDEVDQRCRSMEQTARARLDAMRRWLARRPESGDPV
ncbi:MAG TPA: hypothetical protein VM409_05660 [Chloroflexia bacterium]|nr:hypothetical protein [Chloroflexia bacterium]